MLRHRQPPIRPIPKNWNPPSAHQSYPGFKCVVFAIVHCPTARCYATSTLHHGAYVDQQRCWAGWIRLSWEEVTQYDGEFREQESDLGRRAQRTRRSKTWKKPSPDMDQNISLHESDRRRRSHRSTAAQALTWTKTSITMNLTSQEGSTHQEPLRLEKFKPGHGPGRMFAWVRPQEKTPKIETGQGLKKSSPDMDQTEIFMSQTAKQLLSWAGMAGKELSGDGVTQNHGDFREQDSDLGRRAQRTRRSKAWKSQALTWTNTSTSMSLTSEEGSTDQEAPRLENFKPWQGSFQFESWHERPFH